MPSTATHESVAAALMVIGRAQARCGATKVVSVDGPSGAGKTDLAAALAEHLPTAQVLHMDDLYPGWDGLMKGVTDLHDQVLVPLACGVPAAYRGWDWKHGRYSGWRRLPATDLLIVEGVGSGAKPGWPLVSTLIWLEADRDERFRRGIERDGDSYLPHWLRWAEQEGVLFEVDGTRSRADLIVDTSS